MASQPVAATLDLLRQLHSHHAVFAHLALEADLCLPFLQLCASRNTLLSSPQHKRRLASAYKGWRRIASSIAPAVTITGDLMCEQLHRSHARAVDMRTMPACLCSTQKHFTPSLAKPQVATFSQLSSWQRGDFMSTCLRRHGVAGSG